MYGAFPKLKKHVNWRGFLSVVVGAACGFLGSQLGLDEAVSGALCGALCKVVAGSPAEPEEKPVEVSP